MPVYYQPDRGGLVGGYVGVRQCPAGGPAVANLNVTRQRGCRCQSRGVRQNRTARSCGGVPDQGADFEMVTTVVDRIETRDPTDVNDQSGGEEPHLHQRDETHSARHQLGVIAESGVRLVQARRGHVIE